MEFARNSPLCARPIPSRVALLCNAHALRLQRFAIFSGQFEIGTKMYELKQILFHGSLHCETSQTVAKTGTLLGRVPPRTLLFREGGRLLLVVVPGLSGRCLCLTCGATIIFVPLHRVSRDKPRPLGFETNWTKQAQRITQFCISCE